MLHGDFGVSAKTGREIKTTIFNSFGVSAKLGGMAVLVALISGVVLGSIAAPDQKQAAGQTDHLFLHTVYFSSQLCTGYPAFAGVLYSTEMDSGMELLQSELRAAGHCPCLHIPMAYITRLTKTSMLDALGQDYVRTARAKGVAQWKVIFKHTLRNALIPVITYVGPMTASILTGSLRVHLYDRRSRLQVRRMYYKPRLSDDHGYDDFPGNPDGYDDVDYRYRLQADRPQNHTGIRKEEAMSSETNSMDQMPKKSPLSFQVDLKNLKKSNR